MGIIRDLKNFIKNMKLQKYYNTREIRASNEDSIVVYMADGKMLHGGLSDRLCGLVSTYCYCLEHNKLFKVHFNSPYELTYFLLPNLYDWTIDKSVISYHSEDAIPVYIPYYANNAEQITIAKRRLEKHYKQIHVYSNMRYFNGDFGRFFSDLFKPSVRVSKNIEYNLNSIGGQFISVTFRFQQLLGDFEEGDFLILPVEERSKLIDKCMGEIEKLHRKHANMKVLVTSDSQTFLTKLKKVDYIHTIPGKVVHMDFSKETNMDIHLKSFVDFFVISSAYKIYLVYSDLLYHSTFAKTASFVHNTLYEEIKID